MKPVVVLGLVGVAIAALLFVLLSDPSEPAPKSGGLGPDSSSQETTLGPSKTTNLNLDNTGTQGQSTGTARIENVGERAAVSASGEVLQGAYENGINGMVLDPDGLPVADATVTLLQSKFAQMSILQVASELTGKRDAWTAITGADGIFTFRNVQPSMDYSALAEHPDFSDAEYADFEVPASGEVAISIQMKSGFTLKGFVMDDLTGQPIADADLLLQDVFALLPNADPNRGKRTKSGSDGSYVFDNVSAGTRNVTVRAKGYGSRTRNNILFNGPTKTPVNQDFRLDVGQFLKGRVIGPDRVGIPNAVVEVSSYETAQISRGRSTTDIDGYFKIAELSDGKFMLVARANGFTDQRLTGIELGANPEVVMARQGGVMGNVTTLGDNSVVTKFRAIVRAVAPGSTIYGRTVSAGEFTNDEGAFELGGLEAGSYVMQIESVGFAPTYSESFVVSQGLVTPDVNVAIGAGGSISGRIVNSTTGEPVVGALVETFDNEYVKNPFSDLLGAMVPRTTTSRKARTDKDGAFSITLVTPGTYQIQIKHAAFPLSAEKGIQVNDGQNADQGTIRLVPGGVIRGIVYGAAGRPLAGAKLSLIGESIYPGSPRSDSEGRFVLINVQPGNYRLSAVGPGSGSAGNPFGPIIDMKKSEVQISIFEGREINQDLNLGD
ncbi:MAG: protocatechuate 3,4-dioxygenase beta subunit [Gammaproteobacteria bacterium]|jgi:protocatechuate 3,4-dioxygenase beta subunit